MVFTEKVKASGGLKPLKFINILAILYAFGGVSAVCAILSKFIVQPLFDELSYDRSVYAREARDGLLNLNFRLAKLVSSEPRVKSHRRYVDVQTQTDTTRAPEPNPELNDWGQFKRTLHDFETIQSVETEKKLINDLDTMEQYLRSLMYGQIQNFNSMDLTKARDPRHKDPVATFKQEIRSFKGAVLSL